MRPDAAENCAKLGKAELAAALTDIGGIRWLGMRVPAFYQEEDWLVPKQKLRDHGLEAFHQCPVSADENGR